MSEKVGQRDDGQSQEVRAAFRTAPAYLIGAFAVAAVTICVPPVVDLLGGLALSGYLAVSGIAIYCYGFWKKRSLSRKYSSNSSSSSAD